MDTRDLVNLLKDRQHRLMVDLVEAPVQSYEQYLTVVARYAELNDLVQTVIRTDKEHDDD